MTESTSIESHLIVFKEIVSDLEAMEVKYDDKDLALILLCCLPTSYSTFRDTILYSRDTLTLAKVYDALFSKEKIDKQLLGTSENQGESLLIRRRTHDRNSSGRGKNRSKFRNKEKVCNYYKKKRHIKKECYKLQNKFKRHQTDHK